MKTLLRCFASISSTKHILTEDLLSFQIPDSVDFKWQRRKLSSNDACFMIKLHVGNDITKQKLEFLLQCGAGSAGLLKVAWLRASAPSSRRASPLEGPLTRALPRGQLPARCLRPRSQARVLTGPRSSAHQHTDGVPRLAGDRMVFALHSPQSGKTSASPSKSSVSETQLIARSNCFSGLMTFLLFSYLQ